MDRIPSRDDVGDLEPAVFNLAGLPEAERVHEREQVVLGLKKDLDLRHWCSLAFQTNRATQRRGWLQRYGHSVEILASDIEVLLAEQDPVAFAVLINAQNV